MLANKHVHKEIAPYSTLQSHTFSTHCAMYPNPNPERLSYLVLEKSRFYIVYLVGKVGGNDTHHEAKTFDILRKQNREAWNPETLVNGDRLCQTIPRVCVCVCVCVLCVQLWS